jgi:DNA sulfur modification protein DndB
MTTALPAMKGQFGTTEYYVVTMPAQDLATRLVIPKEMEGWEDLSLEERFQREVNYNRVKKHIAPYLAHDKDRFFGAFIVDIYNSDGVDFEPLDNILNRLPKLYQQAAKSFGLLYLQGNEVLVPLDGQHRVVALRFAISGKDEKTKEIAGLTPNVDVGNDDCTVILVKHDNKKARKIFNKVNRYAKSTSKSDNLITADDDIIAVIAREDVAGEIVNERLVNYASNTLPASSPEFTTLATVYESVSLILEHYHGKINTTALPSEADEKLFRRQVKEYWSTLTSEVSIFQKALQDPADTGDQKRQEIRRDYTLGKPIIQLALVDATLRLITMSDDGSALSLEEACSRINQADWASDNPLWQGVLMNGNKVVTGKQAAKFAARFIAYYLGAKLSEKELEILRDQYINHFAAESAPDTLPIALF